VRHPGWWIGAGISLVALSIVIFVVRPFDESAKHSKNHPPYPAQYAVQMFENQGRDHIPGGQVFNGYNSNPPTSGPHGPAVRWGVYEAPVPKESAVHNMEHGGLVIWYDCEGGPAPLDAAACDQLRAALAGIVQPRASDGMFILMTPYAGMERRIALTAWQYLDGFDDFDAGRIEAFIASFECLFNAERTC
jgi:hypothetical protein